MIVGFTGTLRGMTSPQRAAVIELLQNVSEVHHGDAIGADSDFHAIAHGLDVSIVQHPPVDVKARAFNEGGTVLPARPYMVRNQAIVDACDFLIGTPRQSREPTHSRAGGTWATIRRARKAGKPVILVWPDGRVDCDDMP